MTAMNFLTNILLLTACCASSVSAVDGGNAAEYGDNERPMPQSRNLADVAKEKEMLRDDSIPLVRESRTFVALRYCDIGMYC